MGAANFVPQECQRNKFYATVRSVLHWNIRKYQIERPTGFVTKIWSFMKTPRFSAAGMVRMKNHEKSGWVHLIWNPGQALTAGCGETPRRARTFISDQSKELSQDRERRRKLHRCIQTAIESARRDWSSARRDWRLFFQTFPPSFVISWPISTNEPSLESLKSQQSDGAIFVPVSPRERTIGPFLRRVLTLSAQFPRIRTCSGQINLYRGEIAVRVSRSILRRFQKVSHICSVFIETISNLFVRGLPIHLNRKETFLFFFFSVVNKKYLEANYFWKKICEAIALKFILCMEARNLLTLFSGLSRTPNALVKRSRFSVVFSNKVCCSANFFSNRGSWTRIDSTCLHSFEPLFFSEHRISETNRQKNRQLSTWSNCIILTLCKSN